VNAETFVIVDEDIAARAECANLFRQVGYTVPVESLDELAPYWPEAAWVVVRDRGDMVARTVARLNAFDRFYPLIAYAQGAETTRVVGALLAGAVGYLDWPSAPAVLAGHIAMFREAAADRIGRATSGMRARRLLRDLSEREWEVVMALSNGRTNREIAELLGISQRTVEVHRAKALSKLEAINSIDAVRLVFEAVETTEPRREVVPWERGGRQQWLKAG
jgi:two-component system, LuxR family, response regulator FixJ